MALTTNISVAVKALLTGSTDLSSTSAPHRAAYSASWGSGTGSGQADLVWGDTNTLAASANTDLDLAAGALTGALGGTLTFARVKAIMLLAASDNTNNVVLGGAASNQFIGPFGAGTQTISVPPGGVALLTAPGVTGWAVTAGTGDLLRIANSGAGSTVTYTVLIVGASA